jgi:hypothetical protein
MGARLVGEVSDHWGHLPAGPYKLLMRMAVSALDTPGKDGRPARIYWKGWADLAVALGRKIPDEDDTSPEAVTRRATIKSEVKRHTNALIKLGAVERAVDNPGRGTRQVWKLKL